VAVLKKKASSTAVGARGALSVGVFKQFNCRGVTYEFVVSLESFDLPSFYYGGEASGCAREVVFSLRTEE
jgi:hypothetical protein